MKLTELRKQTKQTIDSLPEDEVRAAADYIGYLAERSGAIPLKRAPLAQRLRIAEEDYKSGRGTPVSKLKRKY